jgi:hypothetical protein
MHLKNKKIKRGTTEIIGVQLEDLSLLTAQEDEMNRLR